MCLTGLHNIQQDLINFIPVFSSLLMQMIFFLLLKQTVLNSDTRYFGTSVIYKYTNPMVMYELMRIRHKDLIQTVGLPNKVYCLKKKKKKKKRLTGHFQSFFFFFCPLDPKSETNFP